MKWFQQQGSKLERTYLNESGNVCKCCEHFLHTETDQNLHGSSPFDEECDKCGALCSCLCHKPG